MGTTRDSEWVEVGYETWTGEAWRLMKRKGEERGNDEAAER